MHARGRLIAALAVLALAAPGVASASPGVGDALVLRAPGGGLRIVDGGTGQTLRRLPDGALSADRKTLLTARVHGASTLVRRISIASGAVLAHRSIPGAWGLQRAAEDGTVVAGGDRGLVVALVAAERANGYRGAARTTRIAVLPPSLRGPLRVLRLHGNFGVDAFGPSGQYLYLIQHLEGEHYKVRAYDLLADRLEPQTVVDKAEPNERMAGLPLARADSTVGNWVLTLYRRPSGVPFVHALMADSLYAFCIDLPAAARVDVADPPSWGIDVRGRNPVHRERGDRLRRGRRHEHAQGACAPSRSAPSRRPARSRDRWRRAPTARGSTSHGHRGSSRSTRRRSPQGRP